ncbi:hypothetical protein [Leptospira interrogans]|uniref:hypothetical protein n=1 Tax=Leptospira interrogans TaxID=173 RepID=UPI000773248A|nr:hypothetical protein [Leptospira interrogans]
MRQKRFSIVKVEEWNNYHFVHREFDTEDEKCYPIKNKITLCGQLDTGSEDYKDKLKLLRSCLTEKGLLQYCIDLHSKKIICAQCIAYFFSDNLD